MFSSMHISSLEINFMEIEETVKFRRKFASADFQLIYSHKQKGLTRHVLDGAQKCSAPADPNFGYFLPNHHNLFNIWVGYEKFLVMST